MINEEIFNPIEKKKEVKNCNWFLDYRKQEAEIWVSTNDYSIFVGEGYTPKEKKRSKELAKVIVKALNENDA